MTSKRYLLRCSIARAVSSASSSRSIRSAMSSRSVSTLERVDRFADEIADQQSEQRVALERCEAHRGLCVGAKRVEPLLGQRVHRSLPRFARLASCLEVAETGESLGLDVVLALTCPVEHAPAACHAQEVVRAGAAAADEAEDLVREEAQLSA